MKSLFPSLKAIKEGSRTESRDRLLTGSTGQCARTHLSGPRDAGGAFSFLPTLSAQRTLSKHTRRRRGARAAPHGNAALRGCARVRRTGRRTGGPAKHGEGGSPRTVPGKPFCLNRGGTASREVLTPPDPTESFSSGG
ncbi:hypothetical protein AAFF_G00058270 [Aldrovandia affinis]|uniref:Uncharacterized protein n=1 Tax=Aldrovandia affinis TaxID=143900 RepID=A0AAD7S0B1_9TELE|nr:hypothetical protein AAFF_G00058270 [Aldrovandia affinis]